MVLGAKKSSPGHKMIVVVLLTIVLIVASTACNIVHPENSSQLVEEKEMPDAMKELAENEAVEWMAGLWVELTNCTMQPDAPSGVDTYSCQENVVQVSVTLQNGLDKVQPYYLCVFADGIPVEFRVEGSMYQAYAIDLGANQMSVDMEFQPEFSLRLGRLDFLLFFDGNPQSDFHMTSYTVCLEQNEEEREPTVLQKTIRQRAGVKESFVNGAYGAWLWDEDTPPMESDSTGQREAAIRDGGRFLLEAIASRAGTYRTVMMIGGQPVSFVDEEGQRLSWLDWESGGEDMLQIPVDLAEGSAIRGSFFAVTTPLGVESLSLPSLASSKIQLVDSAMGVGEE